MGETKATEIRPQPGPQERALSSSADIVVYGGAAGGGKSWALLLEPLRHIRNQQFGAVIFRRTYPQIMNIGGMWHEARKVYPLVGGRMRESNTDVLFPSGAELKFAHLQHERNVYDWQGAQIPLIGFDELTHFTENMFFYMLSRNRSMCGVRPYVRATTNPDADSWVAKLIEWYVDQETGFAIPERSGVIRWFIRENGLIVWGDSKRELIDAHGPESLPKSFTFIAASVYDNKALLAADPGYLANLRALPLVEQERLLGGNWKIRHEAGKVFNRSWFRVLDALPEQHGERVRFWDLAATEQKSKGDDPDWTVGLLLRKLNKRYYVEDVVRERQTPAEVDRIIENTAARDGRDIPIAFEREGGASGVRDADRLVKLLAGYNVRSISPRGDKLQRAKPAAAQAYAGNIDLMRAHWNDDFLAELHMFPDGKHDDMVDALSGAFNYLAGDSADMQELAKLFGWQ